jgi:hypothetical protein
VIFMALPPRVAAEHSGRPRDVIAADAKGAASIHIRRAGLCPTC